MESKDELKEIDTKNGTSYYFDNVIGVVDIDFEDISLNEKSYETYQKYFDLLHLIQNLYGSKTVTYLVRKYRWIYQMM